MLLFTVSVTYGEMGVTAGLKEVERFNTLSGSDDIEVFRKELKKVWTICLNLKIRMKNRISWELEFREI